ncbi:MAG: hypothetical protein QM710_09710 [Flavobacterium sp.]
MKNFLFILILLFLSSNLIIGQSKVEQSKKELNSSSGSSSSGSGSNSSSSSSSSSSRSSNNNDHDDCGIFEAVLGYSLYAIYFTFGGDYSNEDHLHNKLTNYPYYNKESGNYEAVRQSDSNTVKKNFRFDIQDNFIYSGNLLYGNHLKAKIRPFQYFYAQADYHQLFEKNELTDTTDKLSLFFFNLGYDRIRFKNVNIGWTIGASYVGNEVKKAGFSVGLNTEVFIGHNISLLASAKWSEINRKPVNLYELEAKYHLKRCFVSLGFQHLRIASPNYNFATVGTGIYLN